MFACFSPVIFNATSPIWAEEPPPQFTSTSTSISQSAIPPIPGGIQGRISLDLRDIEVVDALKFLAMKAGINIIATKNVTGRITLMVQDVVVKDVFDIMLRSNELAYAKQGDIYNVMTKEEYKAIFGKNFADIRQVKVFRLQYAIPEQAFALLDTLKSEIGRVLVEPDSGTVLIMDAPENIKESESALATLEQKNQVQIFDLKYAKAKDIEGQLQTQLNEKKVGTVKADERSNQVIIQALPERIKDIEKLIQALDTKTKETLIDTKIVRIKLSDDLSAGVEWEGILDLGNKFGKSYLGTYPFSAVQASTDKWRSRSQVLKDVGDIGSIPFSGTTSNFSAGTTATAAEKLHIGIIDQRRDYDVLIKYLQTLGRTQILSNPKLAVVNNQEAKIHVGERQAYVTTTTTTGQTSNTVSEQVNFVDVGIQLFVTPTINDDGYVSMKVKSEISSVVSTLTTPSNNKIPIIDTSIAETSVMVKDGSTIIIGGLRKDEKTSSREQFPFLGKIPLLGFLFSSGTNKSERTELLVMLTPHIVTGDVLTTGDERKFGSGINKGYQRYSSIVESSGLKEDRSGQEELKPYQEYSNFTEEIPINGKDQ